jgi:hypothetical protein
MADRSGMVTRRAVLGGGFAATASALGCTKQTPAADARALRSAAADEQALIARYDAVLGSARPDARLLRAIRSDHAAHLGALRRALDEPERRASTRPSRGAAPLPDLPGREQTAASARTAAAGAAHRSEHAQLLASIGASERSHGEALRAMSAGR